MRRVFVSEDGRVRSGWVVAAFTAVATVLTGGAQVLLALSGLGQKVTALDDVHLAFITWSTTFAALGATLVGRLLLGEEVGLSRARAGRRFAVGLFLAVALVALACGLPAVVGVTTLKWSGVSASRLGFVLVQHALCVAPTAFAEEILVRGVPLKALSRGLHPSAAVALTGLAFGVLHLTNPNASWVAALNVALVGVWFGAVTVRTGSLWMSFGLHVGWNFAEGVLFGQPVSGLLPGTSVLQASWPGEPGFFSGGAFGPEAAGWTAVLLGLAILGTVAWPVARRRPSAPEGVGVPP
ncbi:MAG: type II CAAX endopeptidase family protein [Myxococcota bacterium]